MTTQVNLYSLFLTLDYYDLDLSKTNNWITPVVNELNNYVPRKVAVAASQDLLDSDVELEASMNKGITPLDASMTSEPFDASSDPSSYIDASHSKKGLKKPTVDASSSLQSVEDYKLTYDFDDNSYETLRNPFHYDPDLHLQAGNERPYKGFYKDLKRYQYLDTTNVSSKALTVMTADSSLDITLTADGIDDLTFYPSNTFDASTVSAYKDVEVSDEPTFYDETGGFDVSYWYRYISFLALPLGRTNFEVLERGNPVARFYAPNPYEGYFASPALDQTMDTTTPPVIGLGLLGSYLYGHDREFLLQLEHFNKLQRDYKKRDLLPGLPDEVDSKWNRKNLESNQRSLFSNSLFLLFSLTACIDFAEDSNRPSIPKESLEHVRELILLFSNSILPSDTLVSKGINEQGFPLLGYDIASNVFFLLAVSKYLSFDYQVEIHNAAINIYTTLVEVVKRSYETIRDDGVDNQPMFFLSLFWFADVFDLPELRKKSKEDLNDYLANNTLSDELLQSLVWYTSELYPNDIPRNTGDIAYDPQYVADGVYEIGSVPSLYASTLKKAVDESYSFIGTNEFDLNAEEFKLQLNLAEDTAKATIPIGTEWFSQEDVSDGVVSRLVKAFVSPLLLTELEKRSIREQDSIESAKGAALTNILESYELDREPFQRDDFIRSFLINERDHRGSKEHEIREWLRNRLRSEDFTVKFHRMPSKVYDSQKDEERTINGIGDLYDEVIKYYEDHGEYAVEVKDEDGSVSMKRWEEMVGVVDLEFRGYHEGLGKDFKQVLPAGLEETVTFVLEATYESVS